MKNPNHTPDAIQAAALRTWNNAGDEQRHAAQQLASEAGEYLSHITKEEFKPTHEADDAGRVEELADVLYYISIAAHCEGLTLAELAHIFTEKLKGGHGWKMPPAWTAEEAIEAGGG